MTQATKGRVRRLLATKAVKMPAKAFMDLVTFPSRWVLRREFEQQTFTRFNERPIELSFVFRQLARHYPRKILDVGTGTSALPSMMRRCGFLVTATDNVKDYWPIWMYNRHYHIVNDDITESRLHERFDLITCISVLEHVEEFDAAVAHMFRLLNPTGHLILTFPYTEKEYVKNVYKLPGASYGQSHPYICQSFSRNDIDRWLRDSGGELAEQEFWQFWEGDYWTAGNQIIPPRQVAAQDKHQLSCILIQRTMS
jgi:SAM-dependent methyltransferase